jgi:hypothetical protein
LIDFQLNGNQIVFSAREDADLIAFGGQPLKEKVVSYGPFVMNSFEQIQHAITDYESGRWGIWIIKAQKCQVQRGWQFFKLNTYPDMKRGVICFS